MAWFDRPYYVSSDTAAILLTDIFTSPSGTLQEYYSAFVYYNGLSSLPPVSMTVEGVHYPVTIKGSSQDTANLIYREFYWAPDVGIIKRVISNGADRQVSTLVRHN